MNRMPFMRVFPWGKPTCFEQKITACKHVKPCISIGNGEIAYIPNAGLCENRFAPKLHTIRESDYWKKFVESKKPVLCYYWSGKPYQSKQVVFAQVFLKSCQEITIKLGKTEEGHELMTIHIAAEKEEVDFNQFYINDGLTQDDFYSYFKKDFKGYIYHWTNFSY